MNCSFIFRSFKTYQVLLLFFIFFSCENHRYDSDKRQIMAKDEIRGKLRRASGFDIVHFNEDTVKNTGDSNFTTQIRYTMDFIYTDSNKVPQQKKAEVFFTPDGKTIIDTKITDR
jgi:hypothetical protein